MKSKSESEEGVGVLEGERVCGGGGRIPKSEGGRGRKGVVGVR
jgi:hypothetical protein